MDILLGHFMLRMFEDLLYPDHFDDDFEETRSPWTNAREKSDAAKHREDEAASKFAFLASQVNMAILENTKVIIGLGCHSKSKSPLKLLSADVVDHIMGYVGMKEPSHPGVATGRLSLAIIPFQGWQHCHRSTKVRPEDTGDIDLADLNLFQPGQKITIPFTKPNHHLTQPCYRDLRSYIKTHAGWDIHRVAATPWQKREYKEHRKGKVYFTNVTYKVPGQPPKKRRARKSDPVPSPLSPIAQTGATSALADAVMSAGVNGVIDPACLQCAVDAGYSKHFVLGKAAEHWESVKDTKPPAKKRAKRRKH